jgi:hypothetical protein
MNEPGYSQEGSAVGVVQYHFGSMFRFKRVDMGR